jgi:hypothetical protein
LVELLNGLPRPVSLTCVLRSFDRPLALLATSNLISAQSAVGERSPRMFILSGKLSMSIVPAGDGRVFMEMGEYTTSAVVSIKGEILFPVTEPLDHRDPYRRILADERTGTKCSICHYPEGPVSTLGFEDAFESTAYRPHPQYDVSVDYMRSMHDTCDADVEPERCAIYSALFTHGDVVQAQFPEEMPIFD